MFEIVFVVHSHILTILRPFQVNLLIDDSEALVIADFGLSVFANGESKQYLSKRSGNIQWMAPELVGEYEGVTSLRPTKQSDVYSFSHVCIEVRQGIQ